MVDDHEAKDARLEAARYRVRRDLGETDDVDAAASNTGTPTAHERALYVETVIQQAIRRSEFDDLPGAGKPIEGLGTSHDPDWWIRRKIQTEQLSGLGPPALRLRVEHAAFEAHVDAMTRAEDVRAYTEDFTRRVVEARRQLEGGPPVVTPTRDPDAEVAAWRARRAARTAASAPPTEPDRPPRRWWRRGR
ncbi:DUF1992 domain-containing protein [Microbacterium sp.]|uniref:DnaJ family domain-containing protein n=1 Tax=Microbacterium sp. TaxID=51671 RepID=UPI0037368256